MPKTLNVEKLERKFAAVSKSKDSIQTLSSWIIYHKLFHQDIAFEWLRALRESTPDHRVTLFYVANDVLQHCKKKNAAVYKMSFAEVLEDAAMLAKENEEIRLELLRMLTIWKERNVYTADYLKQLEDVLNNEAEKVAENLAEVVEKEEPMTDAEIISFFKPNDLVLCLKQLSQLQNVVHEKQAALAAVGEVKLPRIETFDKMICTEGEQTYHHLEGVAKLMSAYLEIAEKEAALKKAVVKQLEYSKIFYTAQYDEVKRVVQAYRIFGKKVNLVQKKLDERKGMFPESPIFVSPQQTISEVLPVVSPKSLSSPLSTVSPKPSASASGQVSEVPSECVRGASAALRTFAASGSSEMSFLSSLDKRLSFLIEDSHDTKEIKDILSTVASQMQRKQASVEGKVDVKSDNVENPAPEESEECVASCDPAQIVASNADVPTLGDAMSCGDLNIEAASSIDILTQSEAAVPITTSVEPIHSNERVTVPRINAENVQRNLSVSEKPVYGMESMEYTQSCETPPSVEMLGTDTCSAMTHVQNVDDAIGCDMLATDVGSMEQCIDSPVHSEKSAADGESVVSMQSINSTVSPGKVARSVKIVEPVQSVVDCAVTSEETATVAENTETLNSVGTPESTEKHAVSVDTIDALVQKSTESVEFLSASPLFEEPAGEEEMESVLPQELSVEKESASSVGSNNSQFEKFTSDTKCSDSPGKITTVVDCRSPSAVVEGKSPDQISFLNPSGHVHETTAVVKAMNAQNVIPSSPPNAAVVEGTEANRTGFLYKIQETVHSATTANSSSENSVSNERPETLGKGGNIPDMKETPANPDSVNGFEETRAMKPDCSTVETKSASQLSIKFNLLQSMRLFNSITSRGCSENNPESSPSAYDQVREEVQIMPLGAVFKVLSQGLKSDITSSPIYHNNVQNGVVDFVQHASTNNHVALNENTKHDANLEPMDMDLDSDEST